MGLFDKLFGRKRAPEAGNLADDDAQAPVRLIDAYGREVTMSRAQWRDNILKPQLKASWNDPDSLAGLIASALHDGLAADVAEAARRLHETDSKPLRGACLWGVVLVEQGRADEAESVWQASIEAHGDDAAILFNLAKSHASRGEDAGADNLIGRSLAADPNHEQSLDWQVARRREREGDAGAAKELRRIAEAPGAWRARGLLAADTLAAGDVAGAIALFTEALENAGTPVPGELLADVGGHLGQAGRLEDLVRLVGPRYSPSVHGFDPGNNLMKALVDLGRPAEARAVLESLHAERRPDWKEPLAFWDGEITKARLAASQPAPGAPITVNVLHIEGPAWLPAGSPMRRVLGLAPADAPPIVFIGSTVSHDAGTDAGQPAMRMPDEAGRMSRALPLYLAEHVELASSARSMTLVPFVVAPGTAARAVRGFATVKSATPDAEAVTMAREADARVRHVVVVHVDARGERWTLQARVVEAEGGTCTGMLQAFLGPDSPASVVSDLANDLEAMLADVAGLPRREPTPPWSAPPAEMLPDYMLRLEQLLAARCAAMSGADASFLTGVREIVDGQIELCLDLPDSGRVRLILVETLRALKGTHDAVLAESRDKVALLQRDHPLPGPVSDALHGMLKETFAP